KQAIYRFRGADIGTYVDAVRGEDGARTPRSLATNHRSDARLLDALNALFRGATFDHAGNIVYVPVTAPKTTPATSVTIDGADPAPLEIRWTDPDPVAVRNAHAIILNDLVATISSHLTGTIRNPETGDVRPITHGDLAVLVRSNFDGDLIARFLTEHGIPAVRAGVGAVESSPAAMQWRVLLHAMARPSDTRRVRLAATGWFFGIGADQLTDEAVTRVQATVAAWSSILATQGLHALWQTIRHTTSALQAIASLGDGDRGHTDLEHLVEVLHRGLDGRAAPAERVLTLLDDLRDDAREPDERRRRIESDAAAVQITTIHSSKGLEYPIVLIPLGVKAPNDKNLVPYVFGYEGQRWVDAGPGIDWNDSDGTDPVRGDAATRKQLAALEVSEEDRRLVYVAYTRAKHRLVIWVRHGSRTENGGAGRLLWGPRGADGALIPLAGEHGADDGAPSAPARPKTTDDARAAYDTLAALGRGAIAHHFVERTEAPDGSGSRSSVMANGAAITLDQNRKLERPGWRAWSYSRLTGEGTAISNYGPEHLRDDEPETPASDDIVEAVSPNPWSALSAGTGFGDAIHRILEAADFAALLPGSPEALASLRAVVERHGFRLAPSDDRALLAALLIDTVRTPLGPEFADRSPAEVLERGSLRELEFSFDLGADGGPAALSGIAGLASLLEADDPFREYFSRIGPGMLEVDDARGYLSGSIDLVARDPGTGDTDRYWVVDYKTNREPRGHYDLAAVRGLMEHGNYPLQAALYLVALQRFLRRRLCAAYDAGTHLGGASYWFVRGMVGPATPSLDGARDGVCTWRPRTEFIDAFDALLGGGA
ncbi:MAG: 3'-5' exonuclease, partial [Actinomycetes bacterium]